jgi:hypothetical protein
MLFDKADQELICVVVFVVVFAGATYGAIAGL